jgi:transposase
VEIITGVERRRRWRLEDKLRIVAEVEQPGACFADIARRHEVSRGLLWNWRRQMRRGALGSVASLQFLPVRVGKDPAVSAAAEPTRSSKSSSSCKAPAAVDGVIEITLPDGTTVRVGSEVGAVALRRVLGVLRG